MEPYYEYKVPCTLPHNCGRSYAECLNIAIENSGTTTSYSGTYHIFTTNKEKEGK